MSEQELAEIEARATEYVDSPELVAAWYPDDMAAVLAEVRLLRGLARELTAALDSVLTMHPCGQEHTDKGWDCCCFPKAMASEYAALAKARTAGLL